MTEIQKSELLKAQAVLGEHFDAYVILTKVRTEDNDTEYMNHSHGGGYFNALGMVTEAANVYLLFKDETEEETP